MAPRWDALLPLALNDCVPLSSRWRLFKCVCQLPLSGKRSPFYLLSLWWAKNGSLTFLWNMCECVYMCERAKRWNEGKTRKGERERWPFFPIPSYSGSTFYVSPVLYLCCLLNHLCVCVFVCVYVSVVLYPLASAVGPLEGPFSCSTRQSKISGQGNETYISVCVPKWWCWSQKCFLHGTEMDTWWKKYKHSRKQWIYKTSFFTCKIETWWEKVGSNTLKEIWPET